MNVNLFFIHFGGMDSFAQENHLSVENPRSHQMTLDYFYGQSGELFAYFRIPKTLFQNNRFRQKGAVAQGKKRVQQPLFLVLTAQNVEKQRQVRKMLKT